jgi:hypothetical protein
MTTRCLTKAASTGRWHVARHSVPEGQKDPNGGGRLSASSPASTCGQRPSAPTACTRRHPIWPRPRADRDRRPRVRRSGHGLRRAPAPAFTRMRAGRAPHWQQRPRLARPAQASPQIANNFPVVKDKSRCNVAEFSYRGNPSPKQRSCAGSSGGLVPGNRTRRNSKRPAPRRARHPLAGHPAGQRERHRAAEAGPSSCCGGHVLRRNGLPVTARYRR